MRRKGIFQAVLIAALIFAFAWSLLARADASRAEAFRAKKQADYNAAQLVQLKSIVTNQEEELTILRNATDPVKQKAQFDAFFKMLRNELADVLSQVRGIRTVTRTVVVPGPTRTVVVTRCVRPNGRAC